MIIDPVIIVASPRSGTSLLQKIIRECPGFYSLPSESDDIWNPYCHPSLRGWESEYVSPENVTPEIRSDILQRFDQQVWSAALWRSAARDRMIWSFNRSSRTRRVLRFAYTGVIEASRRLRSKRKPRRLLEKTAANAFRLGFVTRVLENARIVYITRDGRNAVNSIMNGWRHPKRFFTYDVPLPLNISGYQHGRWNFTLPPGWRDYVNKPLEEVCAFQWVSANEAILAETREEVYAGRVHQLRLEDLRDRPETELRKLADFLCVPYSGYFEDLARTLPVVNSPDNRVESDKWRQQNPEAIERVMPVLAPMMRRLGYDTEPRSAIL